MVKLNLRSRIRTFHPRIRPRSGACLCDIRSVLQGLFLLLIFLSPQFAFAELDTNAAVVLLDRDGRPTTRITDGDTVQIRVRFPEAVAQERDIELALDAIRIGACRILAGGRSCETDPSPSFGWYWDEDGNSRNTRRIQALDIDGQVVARSDAIAIRPRPVVMVHGFNSTANNWSAYTGADGFIAAMGLSAFAVGDGQFPGELKMGKWLHPEDRTNTIAENAEVLAQYIAGIKRRTGAQVVDLLAHSMGGLISRYYIDRRMQARDVAQLIMLGSPMGGSDCVVLLAALGFYLPASIELRESYVRRVFNTQIKRRRGIEFHNLGGTTAHHTFKSPCTHAPNDTLVSLESIEAIPLQASSIKATHIDLRMSGDIFTEYVKPLLRKPAGRFIEAADPESAPAPGTPIEFSRVYSGHVAPGDVMDFKVNVDAGLHMASLALHDASRSVSITIRDASDEVVHLVHEADETIRLHEPESVFYLGHQDHAPESGIWHIVVRATDKTPPGGARFALSLHLAGGAGLHVETSTLIPKVDEPVRFDASLSLDDRPLEIESAKLILIDADGRSEMLAFSTGRNVSATWTPKHTGTYAVDVVVLGKALDGSTIERTEFFAIEAQSNAREELGELDEELTEIRFTALIVVVVLLLVSPLLLLFQ